MPDTSLYPSVAIPIKKISGLGSPFGDGITGADLLYDNSSTGVRIHDGRVTGGVHDAQ